MLLVNGNADPYEDVLQPVQEGDQSVCLQASLKQVLSQRNRNGAQDICLSAGILSQDVAGLIGRLKNWLPFPALGQDRPSDRGERRDNDNVTNDPEHPNLFRA